ncbi:MAG: cell envelope integrity protein CreD [Elusimicrobiota bacterium]
MSQKVSEFHCPTKKISYSGIKILGIGVVALGLLIPAAFVRSTMGERMTRRNEAIAEITSSWGTPQTIAGPILVIPYRYYYMTTKKVEVNGKVYDKEIQTSAVANAYFLPSHLEISGNVTPKKLHRGIYEAVVYSGNLKISGDFPKPDWQALKINESNVLHEDAVVSFAIPDLRGAKGAMTLSLAGKDFRLLPGSKLPDFTSGVYAIIGKDMRISRESRFSLDVNLNGSASIAFAPIGVRNIVSLHSPWQDPKFTGAFLPTNRTVSADGFDAKWDVSFYGRNYPQQSTERSGSCPDRNTLTPSFFGVSFLTPVDSYRNVERAVKYAILFISIVFAAFFLFEILSGLKIHPLQYALVGLALCLFFLMLLSLSEFLPFWLAYLFSAIVVTMMSVLYGATFLKGGKKTVILAAELAGIYAYLFVVLQLQDYSLLMGSVLLTAILGAIMYATRDVNWYAIDSSLREAGSDKESSHPPA